MLIYKRLRYRVYPSKSTQVRLVQWISSLKWLWNLANEQRINGCNRPQGERIYPTLFSQKRELTELRKIAHWINDVPRHVASSILENLDDAWNRCFDKICRRPRWKKKSDRCSLRETDPKVWSLRGNKLKFPKLPPIPIVISRPLEGKPKSCTIKRDGDQWFATIVCEIEVTDPKNRTQPSVGIDRGVRNILADSNRRLVENPKFLHKGLSKLARAQRTVARRVQGSNNHKRAKSKVTKIHQTIRRQREHFLHIESTRYTKSHGVVVLEKLNTSGMGRISKGLSRSINDSGWRRFSNYLEYKLTWSGGNLIKVNAAYTSQTCAKCHHIDRNSRVEDKFKCTKCGHEDHSDLNAAQIVLNRASRSVQPAEASSQGTRRRNRKFKSAEVRLDGLINQWATTHE